MTGDRFKRDVPLFPSNRASAALSLTVTDIGLVNEVVDPNDGTGNIASRISTRWIVSIEFVSAVTSAMFWVVLDKQLNLPGTSMKRNVTLSLCDLTRRSLSPLTRSSFEVYNQHQHSSNSAKQPMLSNPSRINCCVERRGESPVVVSEWVLVPLMADVGDFTFGRR